MQHRTWQLVSRPQTQDFANAIQLLDDTIKPLPQNSVLIRNWFLSMDAGTRMWMTDREDSYNPPVPLGSTIPGLVIGEVVDSQHRKFRSGDVVRGFGQWADYSTCDVESAGLVKIPADQSSALDHFGVLGMNGWTALWGVKQTAQTQVNDRLVVSAAAGATGILACQIGKILGAKVYGITGRDDKGQKLQANGWSDATFNYKTDHLPTALSSIPNGINAYFDNVGGDILDAVLQNMAMHGRVAICGLLSQYTGHGRAPGPSHFDQVLMKRLKIQGFFIPDHADAAVELIEQLTSWQQSYNLVLPMDKNQGLENTLQAYAKLFSGANFGKVIVDLVSS